MTALTPDCDPDLSRPRSVARPPGRRVRSTAVLLALVALAVLAAGSDSVPTAAVVLTGGVGLASALVLTVRVARFTRRAGAVLAPWTAAVRRSRPAG
ncbi:hypothetical protein [Geodermatophilus sp. DSM 44513]|uniref:hypothetical protein n=1 Tax=Geodermatophilus sp. DSM 44513 TaxID=1528104 RepID=UPI0012751262|nr:hypothetical protein [Geodermatophilus sp. DSM 44513]WNV73920.1 hypothetical protein RTG05_13085 [Geodermatophilus sp. DSM 44513]